jgi:hypothetical protein
MRVKIGKIIRFGEGSTALMRVTNFLRYPVHGTRYHGTHCMGGFHAAWHNEVTAASKKDLKMWGEYRK